MCLLNANLIFAQSSETILFSFHNRDSSVKELYLPKFDFHIALGFVAGGRVGIRYLFIHNLSTEIAFGYDLRNFIGASEFQRRYSIGFNYHFEDSDAAISFLATYVEQPKSIYEALLLSPNFGLIPIKNSGLQTFLRFGFYIELLKNYSSGKWEIEDLGPNLDVGVSFNF